MNEIILTIYAALVSFGFVVMLYLWRIKEQVRREYFKWLAVHYPESLKALVEAMRRGEFEKKAQDE